MPVCVFLSCTNYGITSFSGINQSPSCDMRRASLHLITKINSLAVLGVRALFEWFILPQLVLLSLLLFWNNLWSHSCDLKQAETHLEMKQTLGVLSHRGPLDSYWGGVTCLDMGEGERRAERQKKSQTNKTMKQRKKSLNKQNRQSWIVTRKKEKSDRYE